MVFIPDGQKFRKIKSEWKFLGKSLDYSKNPIVSKALDHSLSLLALKKTNARKDIKSMLPNLPNT